MKNLLKGKKTYLVSAVTVLYALVVYVGQYHDPLGAVKLILAGAGGASIRAAIAKVEAALLLLVPKTVEPEVKAVADQAVAQVEGQ